MSTPSPDGTSPTTVSTTLTAKVVTATAAPNPPRLAMTTSALAEIEADFPALSPLPVDFPDMLQREGDAVYDAYTEFGHDWNDAHQISPFSNFVFGGGDGWGSTIALNALADGRDITVAGSDHSGVTSGEVDGGGDVYSLDGMESSSGKGTDGAWMHAAQ